MTEAGELLDAVKKHLYYGKPLDDTNTKEELGDLLYYIAMICNAKEWTIEEVMEKNIAKLRSRYPDGFDEKLAIDRNTEAERQILEG